MLVSNEILNRVGFELARIEKDHNVRVLYAVESGSRAWGFASENSDWDVRFLYVHPVKWYVSIEQGRDVIEEMLPGDLDVSGWELRKALRLMRKSNPPFYEWLRSPIVYRSDEKFMVRIRDLASQYFSIENCHQHYFSMARGNIRTHLQKETVSRKKYLYILRPILACLYLEEFGAPPPMEFEVLADAAHLPYELIRAIENLLAEKRTGSELSVGDPIPVIEEFVLAEIVRLERREKFSTPLPDPGPLDELLRETIGFQNSYL